MALASTSSGAITVERDDARWVEKLAAQAKVLRDGITVKERRRLISVGVGAPLIPTVARRGVNGDRSVVRVGRQPHWITRCETHSLNLSESQLELTDLA